MIEVDIDNDIDSGAGEEAIICFACCNKTFNVPKYCTFFIYKTIHWRSKIFTDNIGEVRICISYVPPRHLYSWLSIIFTVSIGVSLSNNLFSNSSIDVSHLELASLLLYFMMWQLSSTSLHNFHSSLSLNLYFRMLTLVPQNSDTCLTIQALQSNCNPSRANFIMFQSILVFCYTGNLPFLFQYIIILYPCTMSCIDLV